MHTMPNLAGIMAKNKTTYRWDPEQYAKHSSSQYEWALELIGKLKLEGRESVLDIGCGDGKVSAAIADRLPRGEVVGIDSSKEMIDLASRQYSRNTSARLTFKHQDVRELDTTDRFDVVFSNATLHWVKDHLPMLSRIRRAMKSNGRLLFQMGGKGNAKQVVATLDAMIGDEWSTFFSDFTFPYGFYGPAQYSQWLTEAGLKPLRVELFKKDMQHKGRDGFAGWIRTTWLPYLERIPQTSKEAFIDALVDTYIQKHPIDDAGIIHVVMVRLEVEAEKA